MGPRSLLSTSSLQLGQESCCSISYNWELPLMWEPLNVALHVNQCKHHAFKHSVYNWSLHDCCNNSSILATILVEHKSVICSAFNGLIPILCGTSHNPVLIRTDLGIGLLTSALACYRHLSVTYAGNVCSILSHLEWILRSGCWLNLFSIIAR